MVISVVHIAHAPSVLNSWTEAGSSSIYGSFLGRFSLSLGSVWILRIEINI
jgi:hypothetical protein